MREAEDDAIGWMLRLRGASPEDWQAFTQWLEATRVTRRPMIA